MPHLFEYARNSYFRPASVSPSFRNPSNLLSKVGGNAGSNSVRDVVATPSLPALIVHYVSWWPHQSPSRKARRSNECLSARA